MKVLALSGSLRTGSFNTTLLNLAVPLLREKGVELELWDFRAAQVPIFDPDVHEQQPPASILDLKARIRGVTGLLVVTPEYNRGLPGSFKNLCDLVSRPPKESPFPGKVVTNMGATPGGFATMSARIQFRQLADALGMICLPGEFVVSQANTAFDEHGQLKDEKRRADLSRYLDRYVALLQQFSK